MGRYSFFFLFALYGVSSKGKTSKKLRIMRKDGEAVGLGIEHLDNLGIKIGI